MPGPYEIETTMTNPFSQALAKARISLGFWTLVKDPGRLQEIISLADAIEMPEVLGAMADTFAQDLRGARAMEERPRVGRVELELLQKLPEGTLGRAFAEHAIANGIDPNAIPQLPSRDRISFMRAHLFETHDIWHTVTGFKTDFASEMGLQAFYFAQFPAQLTAAIMAINFLNLAFFAMDDREARMDAIVRGWTMGKRAEKLFGVRWGDLWGKPLREVRTSLGIVLVEETTPRISGPRPLSVEAAPAAN
jgi:ubiquinone biosynthesis protein Coq4